MAWVEGGGTIGWLTMNGGCSTQSRKSNQRLIDVICKDNRGFFSVSSYVEGGKFTASPLTSLLISILLF